MEADWEFEIGPGAADLAAPTIETVWAGFVDLKCSPEQAKHLPEAAQLPGLAEVLVQLNAPESPVWTSKCDVWTNLEAREFDVDEMDAPSGHSAHTIGCYIDLLPRRDQPWIAPDKAAAACRELCRHLRDVPLRCCRVDLAIRRAFIAQLAADEQLECLGVTAYLTSCGASSGEAHRTIQAALAALADAFMTTRS